MSIDVAQLSTWHKAAFAPARGWSAVEIQELLERQSSRLITDAYGFALADLVLDEAELLTICVDPAAQGKGHGRALLNDLHTRLTKQGAQRIVLEVAANNTAAHRLYAWAGYKEIGRRPRYYHHSTERVDAILMALTFSALS